MKFILSTLLVILLQGCGNIPSCSESGVTELVMDLTKEEVVAGITWNALSEEVSNATISPAENDELQNNLFNIIDYLKAMVRNNSYHDSAFRVKIMEALKVWGENEPALENIRLVNKNEEIKKCWCEGEILYKNGNSQMVSYNAQTVEDGDLYVEVEFLN